MATLAGEAPVLRAPSDQGITEGEWVLVTFEIGSRKRATAAPARVLAGSDPSTLDLAFEPRDWERLSHFACAKSEHVRAAPPSTPSVRMPTAASASDEPEEVPPPVSSHGSRFPTGSRVLIIDPDPEARELQAVLETMGVVVDLMLSTTAASPLLARVPYDAVVLENSAEAGNPGAFVANLRRAPLTKHVPVLLVSRNASSRSAVEAFALGSDDFLAKPVRIPEYAARVIALLREASPSTLRVPRDEEP